MNAANHHDYTLAAFAMLRPDTAFCKVDFDAPQRRRFVRNEEPPLFVNRLVDHVQLLFVRLPT